MQAIRAGVWLTVPLAVVLMLAGVGDPVTESIRYLITWFLSVLVPGVLLWRALVGSRSVPQDLGFGAVLGLCWQLAVWAVFTALGVPRLQWLGVLFFLLTFLAVPRLRRHLARGPERPAPGWWHLVMVACLLLATLRTTVGLLRAWPLPPTAFDRHQDFWYQLGLVQVLRHDVTPPDPSVLGEPLIYHWFPNASIAAQSVMANADPSHVLMHHWQLTFVISLVVAGWAAGEALTGKTWVGAVAGTLTGVLPGTLQLAGYADASPAQVVQGPTGALAALVMLGLVGPTVLILRKQATPGVWIAMALMIGLATGTKPTVLPIMLAGAAVVGLFAWIRERRLPWRIVVIGALAGGGFFLATTFALTGSTGGSRIQLLASLRALPFYQTVTGDKSFPATGGWVLPTVATGEERLLWFAAILVGYYLLLNSARLLSLLGTATSPARRDPAYWWVAGCVAAGTTITLVFSHTGYSEFHFLRTVTALGVVGAVAVASTLIDETTRWRPILAAAGAAFGVAMLTRLFWFEVTDVVTPVVRAYVALLLPAQLVAVAAVIIIVLTKNRSRSLVLLQVIAVVIAAALPNQVVVFGRNLYHAVTHQPVVADKNDRTYLTAAEQEAMIWLRQNAQRGDVAVSNVFCMPAPYRRGCPDDAFWVSGLSGVQQYLGGWAYAPANLEATQNQFSFLTQPSPWPDRLQQSLDAVRRPNPRLFAMLKNDAGVDWVIADLRAGPVSPRLDQLLELAYSNSDIRIYRLR
ncbi:hypothetical protein EV643_112175 [Kribbella sp. VKM Ac-2527]|uniref:4-amino-4-deoxy-L-arabinose transferase-like glycosyltransferase n=1 Tax=Kribbella caucasensis TaxID=2512215 RepID=A0A4R6K9J2_9ACTN|nr:hypothetical protein [Kribbella sp. VKM Ac-2527]TDO45847.1 hypothetical protein EV643_112175 [Kribbella sp. VKM Ac-2527]